MFAYIIYEYKLEIRMSCKIELIVHRSTNNQIAYYHLCLYTRYAFQNCPYEDAHHTRHIYVQNHVYIGGLRGQRASALPNAGNCFALLACMHARTLAHSWTHGSRSSLNSPVRLSVRLSPHPRFSFVFVVFVRSGVIVWCMSTELCIFVWFEQHWVAVCMYFLK